MVRTKKNIFKSIYFNAKNPASFASVRKLYLAAKKIRKDITFRDAETFLTNTNTYTSHKKVQHRFLRRKIIVRGINDQWQIDLIVIPALKDENDGYMYIMVVVDCFSRYAYVEPMKRKFAVNAVEAFKKILQRAGTKPRVIQFDLGSEFKSSFRTFLKEQNIHFFHTSQDTKCAIVERFNRTLQNRLYRYMTARNTLRYIDVLQEIVDSYNSSKHRTLGISPKEVTKDNEMALWIKQYKKYIYSKEPSFEFQVGDKVRITKYRKQFDRGYLPKWQKEIFQIAHVLRTYPETYVLIDKDNEILHGNFYKEELNRVTGN